MQNVPDDPMMAIVNYRWLSQQKPGTKQNPKSNSRQEIRVRIQWRRRCRGAWMKRMPRLDPTRRCLAVTTRRSHSRRRRRRRRCGLQSWQIGDILPLRTSSCTYKTDRARPRTLNAWEVAGGGEGGHPVSRMWMWMCDRHSMGWT